MKLNKVVVLFFLIFTFSFAGVKSFDNIKNIRLDIKEQLFVNDNKKSEYELTFQRPDKVKKEVTAPKLNKGEIYIYSGDTKTVYLPFFDQVTEEKIDTDEVDIINAMNYILNLESNDKNAFVKYNQKKLREIDVKEGVRIEIDDLKKVEGYLVPFQFIIYENGMKIAVLTIKSYKFNLPLTEKEFKLK